MTLAPERDLIVAASGEIDQLAALDRLLAASGSKRESARLVGPDGERIDLPPALVSVLQRAVHELSLGNGISVMPVDAMITTQQAADRLNISRPHLIKMLEAKTIPFQMTGTHRRLRLQDVLDYRRAQAARTQAGLGNLAGASLRDGTYEFMPDDN